MPCLGLTKGYLFEVVKMKHRDIINKMTLEEKAAFLSGKTVWETRNIKRLEIPSIFCADITIKKIQVYPQNPSHTKEKK